MVVNCIYIFQLTDTAEKPPKILQEVKCSKFKYKKIIIIFKIDLNGFYSMKVEGCEDGSEEMLARLNTSNSDIVLPEKARFVFDKQAFFVFVYAKQMEYLVNDFNGKILFVSLNCFLDF